MPNEFAAAWTSAEAVQRLYFPSEFRVPTAKGDTLRECIGYAFLGIPWTRSGLTNHEIGLAAEAVNAIKRTLRNFGASSEMNGMLWARWAMNVAEIRLAPQFVKEFCIWISKPRKSLPLALYRQKSDRSTSMKTGWRGFNKKREGFGQRYGYTLYEVLMREDLPVRSRAGETGQHRPDHYEYALEWKINAKRIKKEPRELKEVCGSKFVGLLSICVAEEATSKRSMVLFPTQVDGKFISKVSRTELIAALKKRFRSIENYSDATFARALPAVVKSRRGKPTDRKVDTGQVR
ncbi:MAG: hypothetical protein JWR22_3132 [Herminiimonas sp.]|nr:hypothetical protein [Herminiimonas sp.]